MNENAIEVKANVEMQAADSVEFRPVEGFICTLDMDTDEGKAQFLKTYGASESLSNMTGVVLNVVDVVTMPGVRNGRNGMPDVECQNTYLITDDGNSYFSQSDGVARTVKAICTAFPSLDYKGNGFLPIVCEEKQLANGNTLKVLNVAI